ncbi:crossover junction endodeoxyribonuclease RuvC [Puniceicoccales bacterium CK1056]|uniref:Crossover junction endodeoxyribonuclease RuvC n=1 Tax=Oceanipulchritudo coccoides TaxID=2706888 RepID=A0A6B2M0R9_9BACT|nr:crossover junction endodeoxyribonuclease RuvC [Oceanipulchritudo coccoides]NDV61340.1 crossover junction endodeoxyribonuclease RuvC [Oceanipulchritudo coccoides]
MPKQSARAQWAAQIKAGTVGKQKMAPEVRSAVMTPFKGIILGIDPSLRGTGLAVVRFTPPDTGSYIASETVSPLRKASFPDCLGEIANAVARLIKEHSPVAVAVEETIYVQNFQTAQKLGAARGAAIGQAALLGIPVFEYPPLRIKQAVVGYGRASKEQVTRQVSGLLKLDRILPFDEADAAAAALCHAFTKGRSGGGT